MVLPLLAALLAAPAAGAVITAGGALVGAAMQNAAYKRSDYMNSPQGIRKNAEEAGFNPLLFVGPGTGTGAQYAPQMGSTIAAGAAAVGDQMNAMRQLEIQKQQLEAENARLTDLTQRQVLQPRVPGIYGARPSVLRQSAPLPFPSLPGVTGEPLSNMVPYRTSNGAIVPGPNPDTQMGVDELGGAAIMEGVGYVRQYPENFTSYWRQVGSGASNYYHAFRRMTEGYGAGLSINLNPF